LLGEVGNGGFWQFFYNSSGDWAVETVAALERIGAEGAARVVRAANSVFPRGGPSPNDEERRRQIKGLSDDVSEESERLGDEIYGMDSEIEEALDQYLSLGSTLADAKPGATADPAYPGPGTNSHGRNE